MSRPRQNVYGCKGDVLWLRQDIRTTPGKLLLKYERLVPRAQKLVKTSVVPTQLSLYCCLPRIELGPELCDLVYVSGILSCDYLRWNDVSIFSHHCRGLL